MGALARSRWLRSPASASMSLVSDRSSSATERPTSSRRKSDMVVDAALSGELTLPGLTGVAVVRRAA
jgi:hypothetical protein